MSFEYFFLSLKLLKCFENFFNEPDFLNAVWTINVVSKKGKAMTIYNIGYRDGTITLGNRLSDHLPPTHLVHVVIEWPLGQP